MTAPQLGYFGVYLVVLVATAAPLGHFMARVYEGRVTALAPVERGLYRLAGVDAAQGMRWTRYLSAILVFNLLGLGLVYLLQRVQDLLPLNPAGLPAVGPALAFNTAVSFASNTNWQAYGGETTMSHLTQMLALTVQNFLSAATGLAVMVALVRGFVRKNNDDLGNAWVDLTRSVIYVLLPLSVVVALLLVAGGVVQSFQGSVSVPLLDAAVGRTQQVIALGPVASQVAIKQLGTNGGGYFNVNSAHPLENATALTNFLELWAILLIPVACCFAFGALLKDKRQGWAVLAAMMMIFVPLAVGCMVAEQAGNPRLAALGVDLAQGNLEGKEVRFGAGSSALWAVATTAASNGSVNSMHDSFTPLGGLIPMWLMQLGEIIFGGVGSGLYGMLMYAIIAVFVAGLMVGRTPEYLGKKIEAFEMKMASLVILLPATAVLVGTAAALLSDEGVRSVANPGAHGYSEILYAFSSAGNNNGSAFAGLTASGPFYTVALGLCMLVGRYWVIVPVLALAGSLARKKLVPPSSGTLPTHGPLFVLLLVGTVLLVGALTFIPALALGPIVEHLQLHAER
jgi:K+-transporting ATPase ATPase A chain